MASPPFKLSRRHVFKTRTAGSYTLTNTTWGNLDTGQDIAIPASVGDDIRVGVNGLWSPTAANQNAYLQVATWNGSALVNWIGSGEPTTTTGEGIPGWFAYNGANSQPIGPVAYYTVVAGDIVVDTNLGPQVTLRLRNRVVLGSGANIALVATTIDPFQWWAENIGPAYLSGY